MVDTEENTFCLSPASFEVCISRTWKKNLPVLQSTQAAITPETKAVCVTHFLGFPAQMREIASIARRHDLLILQDACETMNLTVDGKVGTFG